MWWEVTCYTREPPENLIKPVKFVWKCDTKEEAEARVAEARARRDFWSVTCEPMVDITDFAKVFGSLVAFFIIGVLARELW